MAVTRNKQNCSDLAEVDTLLLTRVIFNFVAHCPCLAQPLITLMYNVCNVQTYILLAVLEIMTRVILYN